MRFTSRSYSSSNPVLRTIRKAAAVTALVSFAASPALAANATSGAAPATAEVLGSTALDQAAREIGQLNERVVDLEHKVDQLPAAALPRTPTAAEEERAKQEEVRRVQFLKEVWNSP